MNSILCYVCMKAHREKKLQWSSNSDSAFIEKGISWKDTCRKFDNHQKSKTHEESVLKIVTLPAKSTDMAEMLFEACT